MILAALSYIVFMIIFLLMDYYYLSKLFLLGVT